MANLDTQLKRESGLFPLQPWRLPAKPPTGSVSQAERQSIALTYSGISAGAPASPTIGAPFLRFIAMVGA